MSAANPGDAPTSAADAALGRLAAVTGGNGFIGRWLVPELARRGWRVRLLLRRDPVVPEWQHLRPEIVAGALEDPAALENLVAGATAIIHVAGLIKAATRRRFFEVNCEGAAALAQAARATAPGAHFLLVSSLAAREPAISDYAASKRAGESAVREAFGPRVTILRPPVVYGPGDRESLRFFQLARHRYVPVPGPAEARAALIHVQDLVRLIAALAATEPMGTVLAAADARPRGYRRDEILGAAARAVGNDSPRLLRAPAVLLRAVAMAGDVARLFGSAAMLNSQKLRELRHADWSVAEEDLARPPGWAPEFDLQNGFADAVAWYRRAGWLPA
ncbi:MAG TPA: NAD(P)-dependent oxidoreductase [Steroidobacteraceae bacterium]